MTEQMGFTGVDWPTRPPAQLRADLARGPGPAPLSECARAWAEVAVELDALVSVARAGIHRLRQEWDSAAATTAQSSLARIPGWLDGLADRARQQAELVRGAVAAAEAARLAMPAAALIDEVAGRLAAVAAMGTGVAGTTTLGAGLAAAMTGDIARAQRAGRELTETAARVMADYERDSTPAATAPTRHHPVPALVRDAGPSSGTGTSRARGSSGGVGAAGLAGIAVSPRVLGVFRPVTVGSRGVPAPAAGAAETTRSTPASTAGSGGDSDRSESAQRSGPLAPVAPLAGASAGGVRGAPTFTSIATATVDGSPSTTAIESTEPLTWAQLAAQDELRVTDDPARNAEHTTV